MVKLLDISTKVKMAPRMVSRWVPGGGHTPPGALARIVKKAAKRPLKNISSEPSQIMTPMASMGGRSWTILPCGAGGSTETAWVTGQFLIDKTRRAPKGRCRRCPTCPMPGASSRRRDHQGDRERLGMDDGQP